MCRIYIENYETKEVNQLQIGHSLVEKVVEIIKKIVVDRKGGNRQQIIDKAAEEGKKRLETIEEDVKDVKLMIQEIRQAVVKTKTNVGF